MIRRAAAVEYRGTADSGRNRPIKALAETNDGSLVELYVKPSGRPELGFEGMANELFATCIAGQLGLPVCDPFLVEIIPEWIDTIPDTDVSAVLRQSCPIAFGSLSAGEGWKIWSPEEQALGARRAIATGIFAFDAFTGNDDRRAEKPNLLVKGDSLRIIDHELCFYLRQKHFPRVAPWELGNLSGLIHAERHILGPVLKGDRFLNVEALRPSWAGLSNECLADYEAAIPEQWGAAAAAIEEAVDHIRTVRDRIDECLDEVRRVLA